MKDLKQVKSSYNGHLKHGDTKNLISVTLKRYAKEKYYDLGNKVIIDTNNLVSVTMKRYSKEKYYDLGKKIIIGAEGETIIVALY